MSKRKLHGKKGKSFENSWGSKDHYYCYHNDYDFYCRGYSLYPRHFSLVRSTNYRTHSGNYNYSLHYNYGIDYKYNGFYTRRKKWKYKFSFLDTSSSSSIKKLPRAKNIKKLSKNIALMDQALLDCYGRFIALLPHSLLKDPIHLYFQFQDTYWWYTDIWQEKYPEVLPKLSLKLFGYLICDDCDILKKYVPLEKHEKNYTSWKKYCKTIPLRGAIILNHNLQKCLLVKGWSRACWSFPRGKIDEREKDARCAGREIYEELGVDISSYIDKRIYLETYVENQSIKLYIIPGVREETKFEPRTRKEIGDIRWFEISKLPTPNNLNVDSSIFNSCNEKINDIFVAPFIPGLKKWISLFRLVNIDQKDKDTEEEDPFIACRYAVAKMDKETLKKVQQVNYSEEDNTILHLCNEWDEWGEQENVEKRELKKKEKREKKRELEEERMKELIRVLKKEEEQKRRELMRLMKKEEEKEKEAQEQKQEKDAEKNKANEQPIDQQSFMLKGDQQMNRENGLRREKTAQEKELLRVLKIGRNTECLKQDEEEQKQGTLSLKQEETTKTESLVVKNDGDVTNDNELNKAASYDIYRNIYEVLFSKKKLLKGKEKEKEKETDNEKENEANKEKENEANKEKENEANKEKEKCKDKYGKHKKIGNGVKKKVYDFQTKEIEQETKENFKKTEESKKSVTVIEHDNRIYGKNEKEQSTKKKRKEKKTYYEETNSKMKDLNHKDVATNTNILNSSVKNEAKRLISKSQNSCDRGYNSYNKGLNKNIITKRDLHKWSKYDDLKYGKEKGNVPTYEHKYEKITQKNSYNSPFQKLKEIGVKTYDDYNASRRRKKYGAKYFGPNSYMYNYYMNAYNSYKIKKKKPDISSVERVGNANTYKIKRNSVFRNKEENGKVQLEVFPSGIMKTYENKMIGDELNNGLLNGSFSQKEKENVVDKENRKKIIKKVLLRKQKDENKEAAKILNHEQSSDEKENNIVEVCNINNTKKKENKETSSEEKQKKTKKKNIKNKKTCKSTNSELYKEGEEEEEEEEEKIKEEEAEAETEKHLGNSFINCICGKEDKQSSIEKKEKRPVEKTVPKRVLIRNNKNVNTEEKTKKEICEIKEVNNPKENGNCFVNHGVSSAYETKMNNIRMEEEKEEKDKYKKEKNKGNESEKRELFIFGRDAKSREEIKKMLLAKTIKEEKIWEIKGNETSNYSCKKGSDIMVLQKEDIKKKGNYEVIKNEKIIIKPKSMKGNKSQHTNDTEVETEIKKNKNNVIEKEKEKKDIDEQSKNTKILKTLKSLKFSSMAKKSKMEKVKNEEDEELKKELFFEPGYKNRHKHLNNDFENPFDILDHWTDEEEQKQNNDNNNNNKDRSNSKMNNEEAKEDDVERYTRYERERILLAQVRKLGH